MNQSEYAFGVWTITNYLHFSENSNFFLIFLDWEHTQNSLNWDDDILWTHSK